MHNIVDILSCVAITYLNMGLFQNAPSHLDGYGYFVIGSNLNKKYDKKLE